MGKVKLTCILILISEILFAVTRINPTIEINSDLKLSKRVLDTVDIKYISENSCYCNIGCLSTIVNLMSQDGYEITDFSSTNNTIICTISNGDDMFRFIYQYASKKLVVVGYDYSKSYIPLTYINDEMRLKK